MALGWALTEDMYPLCTFTDGVDKEFNPDYRPVDFVNYPIPTALDIHEIVSTYVEKIEPEHPFGAKAAGEVTALSGAPAIINAIYDAVGIRIHDLPASAEKILKGLKEKEKH